MKIDENNVGDSLNDGIFTLLRDAGKLQVSDKFESMVFPIC
jgi:hypothetical protein